MYKIVNFSKKQKFSIIRYNQYYIFLLQQVIQYLIFSFNFLQKFLKRPSKNKRTRNKKTKNFILEDEKFYFLTKNLLKIKKTMKKKMKILEIFNKMWFLFWPKEYKYIKKQNKKNFKKVTHRSVNWEMLAKYKIITKITNSKKKKKEKKEKKFNVGFFYFNFYRIKIKKKKKKIKNTPFSFKMLPR